MRERMRTKPVRWRKTMSFPTSRIIQIRSGILCKFSIIVTPCLTRSPLRVQRVLNYSAPCNPSNYATLNQLCIQAHSSSLRCGGSLCKVQSDEKRVVTRNDNDLTAPHPGPPRVGEGILQTPFPS